MYGFNPFKLLLPFNLNVTLRLLRDRPGQPCLYTLGQTWTPIMNSIASCAMSMDVGKPALGSRLNTFSPAERPTSGDVMTPPLSIKLLSLAPPSRN